MKEKLKNQSSLSYASVMGNNNKSAITKNNKPAIVITGQTNTNFQEKFDSIKNALANKVQVPIDNVILAEKKIIVKCKNEADLVKTENTLKQNIKDININIETKKNPIVRIVNIEEEITYLADEEISRDLCLRNELENTGVKITHKYKNNRTKKFTMVIELNNLNYEKVMFNKKIYFGANRYRVFDDFNVNLCYKCNKYGHSYKKCRNKICCGFCSKDHDSKNCTDKNDLKCINCSECNHKYNLKLNTTHAASDKENCKTYMYLVKRNIQKTNYPFNPLQEGTTDNRNSRTTKQTGNFYGS